MSWTLLPSSSTLGRRKRLGFKPPLEVVMDLINRTQEAPSGVH
jgi:hypothetical protein